MTSTRTPPYPPKDFRTDRYYMDTFGTSESETVARNVVIMQKAQNPDEWRPFTWTDYKTYCQGNRSGDTVGDDERYQLDWLAGEGYLRKDGSRYSVTHKFTGRLADYMKD